MLPFKSPACFAFALLFTSVSVCPATSLIGRAVGPIGPLGPDLARVADLNRDGIADIVRASYTSPTLTVLLGRADGGYTLRSQQPLASTANGLSIADLNKDGKLDVVVATLADKITIFLGQGDGDVRAGQVHTLSFFVQGPAIADFNGDNVLDLAVAHNGKITILLGNGDGTFRPGATFNAIEHPSTPVAFDMNGDGLTDLAVPGTINTPDGSVVFELMLLAGERGGTFRFMRQFRITGPAIAVAELDGDGVPDVVASGLSRDELTIYHSASPDATSRFTTDCCLFRLTTADLNGDGRPEIVAAGHSGLFILMNSGSRRYTRLPQTGSYLSDVVASDMNGDGSVDLVSVNQQSGYVQVHLNSPTPLVLTTKAEPATVKFGQAIQLTATLDPAELVVLQTPRGTVTWSSGGVVVASARVEPNPAGQRPNLSGIASTTAVLPGGQHALTARYEGDDRPATGSTTVTVERIPLASFSVQCTPNPSARGRRVACTARVQPTMATGSVSIRAAGSAHATAALVGGQAVLRFTTLAPGTHEIQALYAGDTNFTPASAVAPSPHVVLPTSPAAVVSAAAGARNVASGSIASIYGQDLAAGIAEATAGSPPPTELAGTSVVIVDASGARHNAPLFFVSPGQINIQIPDAAAGEADLEVIGGNGVVAGGTVTIVTVAPGVFTANGNGQGAPLGAIIVVRSDGTQLLSTPFTCAAGAGMCLPSVIDLR
ncbi:MAG TPA: FG-GAP-like repeat-containing protein, partial [Bryobacteraceae bacterium]|nr:FG-GAP-like repeat-containing protein [Bryobacteraceae bacterium]